MQSISMVAKRMRNTMGNGWWMGTNNEATMWNILTVCVFIYLYFLILLLGLICNKYIVKKFPLTWEFEGIILPILDGEGGSHL